jgi:hypothetical protein
MLVPTPDKIETIDVFRDLRHPLTVWKACNVIPFSKVMTND